MDIVGNTNSRVFFKTRWPFLGKTFPQWISVIEGRSRWRNPTKWRDFLQIANVKSDVAGMKTCTDLSTQKDFTLEGGSLFKNILQQILLVFLYFLHSIQRESWKLTRGNNRFTNWFCTIAISWTVPHPVGTVSKARDGSHPYTFNTSWLPANKHSPPWLKYKHLKQTKISFLRT